MSQFQKFVPPFPHSIISVKQAGHPSLPMWPQKSWHVPHLSNTRPGGKKYQLSLCTSYVVPWHYPPLLREGLFLHERKTWGLFSCPVRNGTLQLLPATLWGPTQGRSLFSETIKNHRKIVNINQQWVLTSETESLKLRQVGRLYV